MSTIRSSTLAVLIGLCPALATAQYVFPEPEAESPAPAQAPIDPRFPPERDREERHDPGPFRQGRFSVSLGVGNTFFDSRSYLMLGTGLSFYVVDGLAIGVDGSIWLFDDPFAGTLTPHLTYTFHFVPAVKPYLGTFLRHYMIGDGFEDTDSLGVRGGIYIAPDRSRVHFGGGLVYERQLDCDGDVWWCDDLYPEVSFAISF